MATTYAANATKVLNTSPTQKVDAAAGGGVVRVVSDVITLASQASGDVIVIGGAKLPKNAQVTKGYLITDTSLGTATIAIGTSASTGKYRAAATFTATNTPTPFGVAAGSLSALADAEQLQVLVGTAALPSSGSLKVIVEYVLD